MEKIMTPFDLPASRSNLKGASNNQLLTLYWQISEVTFLCKCSHSFSQALLTVQREECHLQKINEEYALPKKLGQINKQVLF